MKYLLTALLLAACDAAPDLELHQRQLGYFPGAEDCGANRNPGPGEALFFSQQYYGGLCMRAPAGSNAFLPEIRSYGWDGCGWDLEPTQYGWCIGFEEPDFNGYPTGIGCPGCTPWDDPRHSWLSPASIDVQNLQIYLEAIRMPYWFYAPARISSLSY
jgi:hypothetical protein